MSRIEVVLLDPKFKFLEKESRLFARKALLYFRKPKARLEIYLAGPALMRSLNRKFRGKNKAADVLSFGFSPKFVYPPDRFNPIGEIYLNAIYVKKKDPGSKQMLLLKLLTHGILHLLGYTHKSSRDRIKMEAREKQFIKWLTSSQV